MQGEQKEFVTAWSLEVKPNYLIALSEKSVVEYIPEASMITIPGAVDYCACMLFWRNHYIPVFDFHQMIEDSPLDTKKVVVVAYQEQHQPMPSFVAVKVCREVEKVQVSDDQMTDWPDEYPVEIEPLVESLFVQSGVLLSVIDIANLCNEGFSDYIQQLKA